MSVLLALSCLRSVGQLLRLSCVGSSMRARRCVGPCVWSLCWVVSLALSVSSAQAQIEGQLHVDPAPVEDPALGEPLAAVRVQSEGKWWAQSLQVRSVQAGDHPSGAVVRRALRELDRTGHFAELWAELVDEPQGPTLVLHVRPLRLIQQVRFSGGALSATEHRRALAVGEGDAVTGQDLSRAEERLRAAYQKAGYPKAQVSISPQDVDDPRRVLLRVAIKPGAPGLTQAVRFFVSPAPHHPRLSNSIDRFSLRPGKRLSAEAINDAVDELTEHLLEDQFYEAKVTARVVAGGNVEVMVRSGPRFSFRFEGNDTFASAELRAALALHEAREVVPDQLQAKLEEFYVRRGFFDVRVRVERLSDASGRRSEIHASINERQRLQVSRRVFPCLSGAFNEAQLNEEIDGVLSEHFHPPALFGPAPHEVVNKELAGSGSIEGAAPFRATPWTNYSGESHRQVIEHLTELYRSEGYLDVQVGPAELLRRRCRRDSPPDQCLPVGPAVPSKIACEKMGDPQMAVKQSCRAAWDRGERCESQATLVLPIRAGRQAIVYDVVVEGNRAFPEAVLLSLADLPLGQPLRQKDLDAALRRVQDHYFEHAYAFSEVHSEIELSADHTRARVVMSIVERQKVEISDIFVRGAQRTSESLIRSRLAISVKDYFRRSLVRRSEERIEALGVFTSVTVALSDPAVPARRKAVVVTVSERLPQYLDTKGGFASADGFRIGFEYGHRNLGGQAVRLTVRSQLALRPPFLIAEQDVRQKYEELSDLERLERRNTLTLGLPNVGLGPLFRLEAELLDLRSNERDFSHSRDAGVLRLLISPSRTVLLQLGGSVELNDANILGGQSLRDYVAENPAANIRVPEGRSIAYTQNIGASWDRRDRPLSATRGTYLGGTVEHVTAVPLGDNVGTCNQGTTEVFDPVCSELLRISGRASGYLPMSEKGLTLALSLRGGFIQHLTSLSRTYPDRLFFMGGVDTLRGYTQYSLVPQDAAERVLDEQDDITINEIVLRGGDFFVNPRAELRIPVTNSLQTALFVDSGNLWQERGEVDLRKWRFTTGSGIRVATPVGPLVFDYGFNLERVIDQLSRRNSGRRAWEELGAFHFSIGLF